jgi:uncharacterized membrane protein
MRTESLIAGIERAGFLDKLGSKLGQVVDSVVRPGRAKDLLAGTWLGHPVHPLLTDVPIGAWSSALVLDLVGGGRASRGADALVGVGVLAAVPTAATGLSDLADVEDERERTLGTAHALGNATALALYSGSWLARRNGRRDAGVRLAMLGAAVVTGAGFIGGHLSAFRLEDGAILQGPATAPQPCYQTRMRDGAIEVREHG